MKTTVLFFNNEAEVLEYGKKNNIEYIEHGVENAKEEWQEYYKPFAELDGCEVGFMMEPGRWSSVRYCITWRGVKMTNYNDYTRGDKTQALKLAEPLDSQGLSMSESSSQSNCPLQKIGKPTAKKLDEWRNWLLAMREHDEKRRDDIFANMLAKIDECCEFFPEAKAVKWENGYWTFEKKANGITYVLQINSNGNIYENTELSYELADYAQSPSEKAARMMQNGLAQVKKCKDFRESGEVRAKAFGDRIRKFMGGRPF